MWFSANSASYQRIAKNNRTYATIDNWTNVVDPAPPATVDAISYIHAPLPANGDWLVYGAYAVNMGQVHIVYTRNGDTGALVGKAGSDPVGGVNSIPTDARGISVSGLAFVG